MRQGYKYMVLRKKAIILMTTGLFVFTIGTLGAFSEGGKNLFLAPIGIGFIVMIIFQICISYFMDNQIVLDDQTISAKGYYKKTISYKEIKECLINESLGGKFLILTTKNNKMCIASNRLAHDDFFEEITEIVREKVQKIKEGTQNEDKNVDSKEAINKDVIKNIFLDNLNPRRHEEKVKESIETFVIPNDLDKETSVAIEIGGKEILYTVVNSLKEEKGVHAESLLWYLGALGGYSCQGALREIFSDDIKKILVEIDTESGEKYYFGDYINNYLLSHKYSIWGLSAAVVEKITGKIEFDLNDAVQHNSRVVGTEEYAKPRMGLKFNENPIDIIRVIWPPIIQKVGEFCEKKYWPIMFGIAIQEAIKMTQNGLEPKVALQIVMDSAIAMSKIDIRKQNFEERIK